MTVTVSKIAVGMSDILTPECLCEMHGELVEQCNEMGIPTELAAMVIDYRVAQQSDDATTANWKEAQASLT